MPNGLVIVPDGVRVIRDAQVLRAYRRRGASIRTVAEKYGVSPATIQRVLARNSEPAKSADWQQR